MKPILLTLALAACLLATAAFAQQYKLKALEIDHPWSRATPKGAKTGVGYLSIKNTGSEADRLVGASFAGAGRAEIHRMTMDQGVMRMRPAAGGLEIKPGETVELKPDGYHLMFLELKQPLKKGEQVAGTLEFEKSGTVQVQYTVEAVGQKSSMPEMKPDAEAMPGMKNMR